MATSSGEQSTQYPGIIAATVGAVGGAVASGGAKVMEFLGGRRGEDDDHEQVRP